MLFGAFYQRVGDAMGGCRGLTEVHVHVERSMRESGEPPADRRPGDPIGGGGGGADHGGSVSTASRVRILARLNSGPCAVRATCSAELEMEQPAVSRQLRVLRDLGFVVGTRTGRNVIYGLFDTHIAFPSRRGAEAHRPRVGDGVLAADEMKRLFVTQPSTERNVITCPKTSMTRPTIMNTSMRNPPIPIPMPVTITGTSSMRMLTAMSTTPISTSTR